MMDEETRIALDASIAAWAEKLAAENPWKIKTGAPECPLCLLFYDENCRDCPVALKASATSCKNTPYRDAVEAIVDWRCKLEDDDATEMTAAKIAARAAIKEELDFLKSLRAEDEE